MRHADHRNANTYGGYYQNAISTVDGQATYFGLEQQLPVLHELFRGFSIRRDYQFRPEVPLRLQSQMNDTRLVVENDNGPMDRQARQKIYDGRRRQRNNVLRADQQRRSKESTTSEVCAYESDFQQARRLMPERDRLAESLFQSGSLRDAQGMEIMKDLVALFSSRNSDTYCVELNSSRSRCDTCGVVRTESTSQEWWRHVYHCRKGQSERAGGFTDFCFLCFAWFDDMDAWSEHNKQHDHNVPQKCSLAMFRGTVLRPAWCPDCVSQTGKPGFNGKALTQFLNVTAWKAHMDVHVHDLRPGPQKCSHPRCAHLPGWGSIAEYIAHRFDVHLIPAPDGAVNGTTRWIKASNNDGVDDGPSRVAVRFQESGSSRSPQPSSTPVITCPSSEESLSRADPRSSVSVEEGDASGGDEENKPRAPASKTEYDADHDQACPHWPDRSPATMNSPPSSISLSSSSSGGPVRSSESAMEQCQQRGPGFQSTPPKSDKAHPTTIEVLIPTRPLGWENVPLVNCIGCTDELTDDDTTCEEVAPDGPIVEAEAGQAAHFSQPTFCFSKGPISARKPRIGVAGGTGKRILENAVISERLTRRRNAITEMHARIRERRRPRLKIAATSCA